ncbi:MAG: alpha/beta hydrolase [Ectothiorhodospiraceae bacterium]|nr:alpha/beta hydrolase [Chromatiales bacterium]MCP5157264.1 alpha/beta hydrolase [Ectothiorhodospiraceae bacterium]
MPMVERPDAEIYYESHGTGPRCVVFAHGRGGNAASWWQQIPVFAARHRVIVFDHRGFGRSRCAPEAFHTRHFAADLLAVLDHAGVARAALVCQSMGGRTGVGMAVEAPQRLDALVLACTPGGIDVPESREAGRRRREAADDARFGILALAADYPAREPAMATLYEQIRAFNTGPGPRGLDGGATDWVAPSALAALRVPTLMITADEDQIFPPPVLHAVAPHIPGVEVVDLVGVGHSTYFEDAPTFNRVVGEFLGRHLGP